MIFSQIDRNGLIAEAECKHIWMVPFLRLMPAALADKTIKTYLHGHKVYVDVPIKMFDWHRFMSQAKDFFNTNFMPFVLFLSGGIGAFHYEKILSSIGKLSIANTNRLFVLNLLLLLQYLSN